jgi:hypothetical protein
VCCAAPKGAVFSWGGPAKNKNVKPADKPDSVASRFPER